MSNCCEENRIFPYRVVQTMYERNTIPCEERVNGMIVTVVGADSTYNQYILKGGDPCVNSNWQIYHSSAMIASMLGHFTLDEPLTLPITDDFLNARFPEAIEGFKATVPSLNTTFMKIFNNRWIMSNNIYL